MHEIEAAVATHVMQLEIVAATLATHDAVIAAQKKAIAQLRAVTARAKTLADKAEWRWTYRYRTCGRNRYHREGRCIDIRYLPTNGK